MGWFPIPLWDCRSKGIDTKVVKTLHDAFKKGWKTRLSESAGKV